MTTPSKPCPLCGCRCDLYRSVDAGHMSRIDGLKLRVTELASEVRALIKERDELRQLVAALKEKP